MEQWNGFLEHDPDELISFTGLEPIRANLDDHDSSSLAELIGRDPWGAAQPESGDHGELRRFVRESLGRLRRTVSLRRRREFDTEFMLEAAIG